MRYLFSIAFAGFIAGCSAPHEAEEITIRYEDVPIFIMDDIRYAKMLNDERFFISLPESDSVALKEAMAEIGKKITVEVFIGDSSLGEMIFLPGNDFDTLNFPMTNETEKLLKEKGIPLR